MFCILFVNLFESIVCYVKRNNNNENENQNILISFVSKLFKLKALVFVYKVFGVFSGESQQFSMQRIVAFCEPFCIKSFLLVVVTSL